MQRTASRGLEKIVREKRSDSSLSGGLSDISLSSIADDLGLSENYVNILYDGLNGKVQSEFSTLSPTIQNYIIGQEHNIRYLEEQLRIDDLTGLASRGAMLDYLKRGISELERTREYESTLCKTDMNFQKAKGLCLIYLDIDFFKLINDLYNHSTGDKVLKRIGETLLNGAREGDCVARFGGEEILLAGHVHNLEEATALAQRINTNIHNLVQVERIGRSNDGYIEVPEYEKGIPSKESKRDYIYENEKLTQIVSDGKVLEGEPESLKMDIGKNGKRGYEQYLEKWDKKGLRPITLSMGVIYIDGTPADNSITKDEFIDEMIANADGAMYHAKLNRNGVAVRMPYEKGHKITVYSESKIIPE